jgi:hypothetical protein
MVMKLLSFTRAAGSVTSAPTAMEVEAVCAGTEA